jgi:mannose-1-phosphate guanylyltransferase
MGSMQSKVHAVVLCGGSGSRLWPRSRSGHPKHLLELDGGVTLVQQTIRRLGLPVSQVYCVTEKSHDKILRQQVPEVPDENIVVEPGRQGTAGAIALALSTMTGRVKPEDVVLFIPADQLVQDVKEYKRTITAWAEAARLEQRIVALGIQPTYPSTGFGYINVGKRLHTIGDFDMFSIAQFVEKPNEATAKTYLASGKYLWNAGMFAAQAGVFLNEYQEHLPGHATFIEEAESLSAAARDKRYLELPEETIDYGILEKSSKLGVVPASFDWADVGSWADLHDVLEHDEHDNVFEGEYVDIDTKNCFVYSPDRLVATIGLEDLVIINTKDAILICPKDRSQDVKKVVTKLKERGQTKFL